MVSSRDYTASAMAVNCSVARFCSFSKNGRPFFTLMWSQGSRAPRGSARCSVASTSTPPSARACHHRSGLRARTSYPAARRAARPTPPRAHAAVAAAEHAFEHAGFDVVAFDLHAAAPRGRADIDGPSENNRASACRSIDTACGPWARSSTRWP